jgi:hypothetical protein
MAGWQSSAEPAGEVRTEGPHGWKGGEERGDKGIVGDGRSADFDLVNPVEDEADDLGNIVGCKVTDGRQSISDGGAATTDASKHLALGGIGQPGASGSLERIDERLTGLRGIPREPANEELDESR